MFYFSEIRQMTSPDKNGSSKEASRSVVVGRYMKI